ncbi:unnamed protein product, partial [Symbiodinium sp. CCMP2456]
MGRGQKWQGEWQQGSAASWWQDGQYWARQSKPRNQQGRHGTESQQGPVFPTFDMMPVQDGRQDRPQATASTGQAEQSNGGLLHSVQRAINAVRKIETKNRKTEQELEATKEKWETFQKGLKQTFIQERTKYLEKKAKLVAEKQEQEAAQAEALAELKEAFANPKRKAGRKPEIDEDALQEWEALMQEAGNSGGGVADRLLRALEDKEQLTDMTKTKIMEIITGNRKSEEEFTPPRRSTAAPRRTPPPVERPERRTSDEKPSYNDVSSPGPPDPYQTSPAGGARPSLPRSTRTTSRPRHTSRMPIKALGRMPLPRPKQGSSLADKLSDRRKTEADKMGVVLDSDEEDEEMAVGDLTRPPGEVKQGSPHGIDLFGLVEAKDGILGYEIVRSETNGGRGCSRRHPAHRGCYDIFDFLEILQQWGGIQWKYHLWWLVQMCQGWILSMMAVQLMSYICFVCGYGGRGRKRNKLYGQVCGAWAVVVVTGACGARGMPMAPNYNQRIVPTTDLEFWAAGQRSLAEQLENQRARWAMDAPLEHNAGEARLPTFHVDPPGTLPMRTDLEPMLATEVHISIWVLAPYSEAEMIDIEVNFPVNQDVLVEAIKTSAGIIPDYMDELIATTLQINDNYASYLATPGWLKQTDRTALVMDTRAVGGTVYGFYANTTLTKEAVLQNIIDVDVDDVNIFAFGSTSRLRSANPIEAKPGGVVQIRRKGDECEWSDRLESRLLFPQRWNPAVDPPPPREGLHAIYQSQDDQAVQEICSDDEQSIEATAAEALELPTTDHWVTIPETKFFRLAHAGKRIWEQYAVLEGEPPEETERAVIFLDLRGLTHFPQWMQAPTKLFNPADYVQGLQLPRLRGWTLIVEGGEPIEDTGKISVRSGEVLTLYLRRTAGDEDSMEVDDESSDSSSGDSGDDSDPDSYDLDAEETDGEPLPPRTGNSPRRGPPPPQPVNRSRSPRRRDGTNHPTAPQEKRTLALDDHLGTPEYDLTRMSLRMPHAGDAVRPIVTPWSLDWLWYDLGKIELHPAAKEAVEQAGSWKDLLLQWTGEPIDFHLYTDGSAKDSGNASGYSVVILMKVGAAIALLSVLGEQVLGNADTMWPCSGAAVIDAEQIAVSVAILWAIQMRATIPQVRCTVLFDCLAAGYGASGEWSTSSALGDRMRNLDLMAQGIEGLCIEYEHVKAHSGCGWNEAADCVAKAVTSDIQCAATPPQRVVQAFLNVDLGWAGFGLRAAVDGSVPFEGAAVAWSDEPFRPFQIGVDQLIPTVTTSPMDNSEHHEDQPFHLKACTINIQGIAGNFRYIEEQLDKMDMNIVFVQETKSRGGQCKSKYYYRLATDACKHFGVAIWFHASKGALVIDDVPQCIREEDIEPTNGKGSFPDNLSGLIKRTKAAQILLCGIDLNGRVPNEYDMVTGDLVCDEPDQTGRSFVDILATAGVWIPSTYRDLHKGDPYTYCHPSGAESRIDYLLVGGKAVVNGACSEVIPEFDNGSPNIDHRLAAVMLAGTMQANHGRRRLWRPTFDLGKMATEEGKAILSKACATFKQPEWDVHPDEHCQMLQDHLLCWLQTYFATDPGGGRASYIPAAVWQLRDSKNRLKRITRHRKIRWMSFRQPVMQRWKANYADDFEIKVAKQCLLYEVAAAAIAVATKKIKTMIATAKDAFLRNVATEGHQSVSAVLQRARRAGIGGRNKKPVSRPLPKLIDPNNGEVARSAGDRDNIWLHFFGEQEQGDIVPTGQFIEEASQWKEQSPEEWEWNLLPSALEIEKIFRRTPKGKAPGLDGIPSDVLSLSPCAAAQMIQPLYFKAIIKGRQPLQWRGGILYEAYKNAGPTCDTSSHRSLYISSFLGKSLHKLMRGKVQNEVQTFLHPLHCGSKQHTPILFPSLFVVEHLRRCRQQGKSAAILFIDCRAAYYRLVRELAVGDIRADRTVERLFAAFGLDGADIGELRDLIADGGMFRVAEMPPQVCAVVQDFHRHTWATTRFTDGNQVCTSKAGSRPGASWADTLFAFIYAKILYKVHEIMEGEEVNFSLPWDSTSGPFATNLQDEPQPAWDTTWADDTAWAIEGNSAEELLSRTARISSVVISLFRSHGLAPNLKRDKTSIIMRLVGAGATKVRKKYFSSGKPELYLPDLQEAIPVVKIYKHLGAMIDPATNFGNEVKYRTALASAAYNSAKDLLLNNRDLKLETRTSIFQCVVVSTYFNLPLWIAEGREWEKMSSAFSRIVRRLLAKEIDGPTLFRAPLPLIHWATGCWTLDLFARRGRMSALISLAKAAPDVLWAMLQNEGTWNHQLCRDLSWFVSEEERQWPQANAASWPHWCHVLRESADRIKRRVRRLNHMDFLKYQTKEAVSISLWSLYRTIACPSTGNQHCRFRCFMCECDFKSKAGLGAHFYKTHGRVAEYRKCVVGTYCSACQTEYWTQGRLEDHLRASVRCSRVLLSLGNFTDEIPAGYGSKRRRQRETDNFTPAPPRRDGELAGEVLEQAWTQEQKDLHRSLCAFVQEAEEATEEDIVAATDAEVRKYPLYSTELREVLQAIASEATALQDDDDIRPWSGQQFRRILSALETVRARIEGSEAADKQEAEELQTRSSFEKVVKDYDWTEAIESFLADNGTQSSSLYILKEGWEAMWPPNRGERLSIAVVKDPLQLLPTELRSLWSDLLKG